ncbi:MAG: carbohydrate ABC transporter permease [Candidatus Binatia bacterium]
MARRRSELPTYITLAVSIIVVLVPVGYMILTALTPLDLLFERVVPRRVTLENLFTVFSTPEITLPYRNSFVISTMTALITLLMAAPAAYGLSRYRVGLSGVFIVLILFTQVLPMEILVLSYFPFLKSAQLMDTWVALILVDTTLTLPFCTLILKSMFDSIPKDIEHAARIDGCSSLQCFFRITIPLSWGGLLAAFIFAFLMAWQEFVYGLTFTASFNARPITVALSLLIGHYTVSWEDLMATSFLTALPLLIIFAIFQGVFIRGLIAGGVK